MSWSVYFWTRAGQPVHLPANLHFLPRRYSWTAVGGPEQAEVAVAGPPMALWNLLGWLRYPVVVHNGLGEPVWWGYVAEVTVAVGGVGLGVSLDSMYNRVAVAFSYVEPGSQTVGTRETTDWSQDDDSAAEYGMKELLASVDGATVAQAENARDVLLAQHRLPVPVVEMADGGELEARLLCRGWWETLRWRYYANGATNSVETTAQVAAIVDAVGQFFTGVDVVDASGIYGSEYRSGDNTALDEVAALLRLGTGDGRRLLATVTVGRLLRVEAEPQAGSLELFLAGDGLVVDLLGRPLAPGLVPVGRWVGLRDVLPGGVPAYLGSPSPFFVERGEYAVERGRLSLTPRGLPSPWEVVRLVEG
ncbi:hypothetical protein [Caldilinea sp.]|uniref:hypothetical protein n=1 Tax=Caldilinea sp. TaxID=2293560 RepID=UPI0021DEB621|nr:hypothetical protein [Caldilinea sp.]GIV73532.1 MAG: hypothetical protein KatS3mg049_2088 [Caldilinea sp.]